MSIFACASSSSHVRGWGGVRNETPPGTPSGPQSARLELAAATPATFARCEGPFAQSDAAPESARAGGRFQSRAGMRAVHRPLRSEEHTSELQSPCNLV